MTPLQHLELLRRHDRALTLRMSIGAATAPGARVLDAGCGLGLLSFWALGAGAAEAVAVDLSGIELARELASANGLEDRIRFLRADLASLDLPDRRNAFDLILAMVYLNDPRRDEPQSALVYSLRDRYLAPGGTMIPDRVRYVARACEWPAQDYPTRRDELRARITQLEGWYGLRLRPLTTAVEDGCWHAQFPPKRPDGRLALEGARLISPPTSFVEIDYRSAPVRYPGTLEIVTSGPGLFNTLVWTQEIWYGEQLLFANESVSWVRTPKTVGAGSRCTLRLGDEWRRLNLATIAESR